MRESFPAVTASIASGAIMTTIFALCATAQAVRPMTPAEGHTIHVTAPHVVSVRAWSKLSTSSQNP